MISKRTLELFKRSAKEIPAYRNFLQSKNLNPTHITSIHDFDKIPITSKKDYLQLAKHQDLVWPKEWAGPIWFCSTSGSTGEPYYFPRNKSLAEQASCMAEMFLQNSTYGNTNTLVLMGFGMGVWIGGLITLNAFEIAAERMKMPVAFLPTGYNKAEVFKALKKLAPQFDQTILVGYPPFVKEVVDQAAGEGIELARLNMRLMFAAEAFTETFRNYVSKKAGISNPLVDTLNIYGTADVGAMAYETPLSILIRRLALEDPDLYKELFTQIEKTPTLAQYDPEFIEFEEHEGEILLTADAALPLIRYAIGDHGGVLSYNQIEKLLSAYEVDLEKEIKKAGIEKTVTKKPFVYVYERTDLSTTLHGLIIYPEFIKEGLLEGNITGYFTERFTMATKHDVRHNQFLQINVELQPSIEPSKKLENMAHKAIETSLLNKSSEYFEISKSQNSKFLIQVVLWPNAHPRYFAPGTKQNWVEKA